MGHDVAAVLYLVTGVGVLLAALLPPLLLGRPLSLPVVFLGVGAALFLLPLDLPSPDPVDHQAALQLASEITVIISLMGAGLALDRPLGWRRWGVTWRLIGVAMPLTIGVVGLLGYTLLALPVASALLLGAVLAPTDPVLASDVQVGEPSDTEEAEDEVRFALTSEAGLNDAAAFPFVNLALALLAVAGLGGASVGSADGAAGLGDVLVRWALVDAGYKAAAGAVIGLGVGWLAGRLAFRAPVDALRLGDRSEGFVAIGLTFASYGLTELVGGYGFLAVFLTAVAVRGSERRHGYHHVMHEYVEQTERMLAVLLLLVLGGAVVDGILAPLTWAGAAVGLLLVLVVRPIVGLLCQVRSVAGPRERIAIAFFGVRGIGSLYYLAFAGGAVAAAGASDGATVPMDTLWAVVAFTIVLSVVLHGITAGPAMRRLDVRRERITRQRLRHRPPTDEDVARTHV